MPMKALFQSLDMQFTNNVSTPFLWLQLNNIWLYFVRPFSRESNNSVHKLLFVLLPNFGRKKYICPSRENNGKFSS
ncbi:hypothetical protein SDJN02_11310, partial [Cucurbita argyrosperma subsp. argyrosperma]